MFASPRKGISRGGSSSSMTAKFYTTLPPPPVVKFVTGAAAIGTRTRTATTTTTTIKHPIITTSSTTKCAPPPSSPQTTPRTARTTPRRPRTPKTSRTPKNKGGAKVRTPPQQRPMTAPQHRHQEVQDPKDVVSAAGAAASVVVTPRPRRSSAAATPRRKTTTMSPPPPPPPSASPRTRRRSLNVVLPPRNISNSSIDVNAAETHVVIDEMVRIKNLHCSEAYSPHKSHWIKCALENLGTGWIRDGKISKEQLVSEEFEEKMGVLYDLAMAKNHEAIDLLTEEMEAQRDRGDGGRTRGSPQQQRRKQKQQAISTTTTTDKCKLAAGKVKSQQQQQGYQHHLMDVSPDCMGGAVQRNFPFAAHFSEENKTSMSDALLSIMMREEDQSQTPSASSGTRMNKGRGGDTTGQQKQKQKSVPGGDVPHRQKSGNNNRNSNKTSKNNNNTGGDGAIIAAAATTTTSAEVNEASMASNNSFDRSLEKRSKSLVPCYVIDGRLFANKKSLLHNVGGSIVNNFGDTTRSRLRKPQRQKSSGDLHQQPQSSPSQTSLSYFRRTANMMGFLSHELTLLYCKSPKSLIVSGSRPARGENENARKVREVIDLPKTVNVNKLLVLRTGKGSLIFEEVEEEDADKKKNKEKGGETTTPPSPVSLIEKY